MKKSKAIICIIIICAVIVSGIYVLSPFPEKDKRTGSIPLRYAIDYEGMFEKQGRNQCSAFSTAYILRFFGKDIEGARVYQEIKYKIPVSGYVLPKGIIAYLKESGLNPHIYTGTLDNLKIRLTDGNPIIVLVGKNIRWQHYMTLIGFDSEKKELYFFDSGRNQDENGELPGNRTMTEEYFLSMWNNGLPVFNRVYITIE